MASKIRKKTAARTLGRLKRRVRIKKRIKFENAVPRLCVFKSNKHIYAQLIDDLTSNVIAQASTQDKSVRKNVKKLNAVEAASLVGKALGERAKEKKHERVAFDRNGFRYHGRIKALADGAREAGLKF